MAAEQGLGLAVLAGKSVASLGEKLNKALIDCDQGGGGFKARMVTHLKWWDPYGVGQR